MKNDDLIDVAADGNMAPLLAELRKPGTQMSGAAAGAPTQDSDYPDNDLFLKVQNAYGEGRLTDKQFDAAHAAVTNDGDGNDDEPDDD